MGSNLSETELGTAGEASKRQVNVWLSEDDFRFLRELARQREQSVSALLRHAVKRWRHERADRRPDAPIVRRE